MSKVADWIAITCVLAGSICLGTVVMWVLKESGLGAHFISQLPSYKIDGILVFMAVALAVSYRSEEGRFCLQCMLIGAALMIGCHLVLHGLPPYDKQDPTIVDAYAIFGAFFYVGILLSLSSACLGVLRRDTREHISPSHR